MKRREILRNPVFPKDMDDETIKLLTQLCFSHQDTIIGPIITALMIFGTSVREHHYACSLLFGDLVKRTAIRNVYLTGGSCTDGLEAYLMAHRIGVKNYPLVVF
ncbi:MAG: hypothetical protein NTZ38_02780, partial [Candidatus Taylorbacteria bacterium]|nr:hypothetical protein [Candidatus Taylorbacteria bacterium]